MFFFGLIVGVVLVIAAIANMILTNLSDIISVLASFIFLGWTIIQTVREIELPDGTQSSNHQNICTGRNAGNAQADVSQCNKYLQKQKRCGRRCSEYLFKAVKI